MPAGALSRPLAAAAARRILFLAALLGIFLVLLAVLHRAASPLGCTDVFWQVRTGEITLETGRIPDRDPFSYTMPGAAWNNHEWLYEILAALLHRFAGWGGFRVWTAALVLATAVGLTAVVGRRAGPPAAFLVLSLFSVLAGYKMAPTPQALSMALFLAAYHFCRGPKLAGSPGRWAGLTLLMLVWGNLTAESLMFLPFLLLDQATLRLSRGFRGGAALPDPARHATLCALACVAPLVNPPQASVLDYAISGTAVNRLYNVEFAPIWAPATTVLQPVKTGALVFMAFYVVWAALSLVRSGDRWGVARRVGPGLLAVLLAAAFERNLWLLLLPAARLVVDGAAWARGAGAGCLAGGVGIALGAAIWLPVTAEGGWTPSAALRDLASPAFRASHLDERAVPVACVDRLAGDPSVRRVFALRPWASYVIWRLPAARVFIDGRNREYPVIVHQMADHVWEGGPIAQAILDATRTDTVVAVHGWGEQPALRRGSWVVAARGPTCELYLRGAAR